MKRFVDIRAADTGWAFAWWDTVNEKFETHSHSMAWDTFEEFASHYEGTDLARYEMLAPEWTKKQPRTVAAAFNFNNSAPLFAGARDSYRQRGITLVIAEGHIFAGSDGCVARFDDNAAAAKCLQEAGYTRDPITQNEIYHP